MRTVRGFQETPTRIAKIPRNLLRIRGRQQKSICLNRYEIIDNNMVVEKDIFFHSMCEHHFTILWKAHTVYTFQMASGWAKTGLYGRSILKPDSERLTVKFADALMEYLGYYTFVWVEADICV